jgi:hypothetical protein
MLCGLAFALAGCASIPTINSNQYFCPPEQAYDATGKAVSPFQKVTVEVPCYKAMTEKQRACYTEVR